MEEDIKNPSRPNYINYGSGVLMVVLGALLGRYQGGFWWWIIGSSIVGLGLVLHGHFPGQATKKRIGIGLIIAVVIGFVGAVGWLVGRYRPMAASSGTLQSSNPSAGHSPSTSVDPAPAVLPTKSAKEKQPTASPREAKNKATKVPAEPTSSIAPPLTPASTSVNAINNSGPCPVFQIGGIQNTATGGNCAPPIRSIKPEDKTQLLEYLSAHRAKADIMASISDKEAFDFAQDLADVFHSASWDLEQPPVRLVAPVTKMPSGVRIGYHGTSVVAGTDKIWVQNLLAVGVIEALQHAHVRGIYVNQAPEIKEGLLQIWVNSNPDK